MNIILESKWIPILDDTYCFRVSIINGQYSTTIKKFGELEDGKTRGFGSGSSQEESIAKAAYMLITDAKYQSTLFLP